MARWSRLPLRGCRPRVRSLSENARPAEKRPVLARCLFLDCPHRAPQKAREGALPLERRVRKLGESEFLCLGPTSVEAVTGLTKAVPACSSRPIEPVKRAWLTVHHQRQGAQARPLAAVPYEALLRTMGEDVAHPLEESLVIEDWRRRVATFPERAAPAHERTNLLGDVRHQVLHEARKIPIRSTQDQVDVIGENAEGEELDAVPTNGPCEYTSEDFRRLVGRTEQISTLKAARRHQVNLARLVHPDRSSHTSSSLRVTALQHKPRQGHVTRA